MNEKPLYLRGMEACGRPGEGFALPKSEGLKDPAGGKANLLREFFLDNLLVRIHLIIEMT